MNSPKRDSSYVDQTHLRRCGVVVRITAHLNSMELEPKFKEGLNATRSVLGFEMVRT